LYFWSKALIPNISAMHPGFIEIFTVFIW